MNVLIIPVNYNSYDELNSYIGSLNKALTGLGDSLIEVHIADNSSKPQKINLPNGLSFNLVEHKFPNLGYFGAAFKIINDIHNISSYDYVIITNVDMTYDETFFKELGTVKIAKDVGWLSPFRFSEKYGRPIFVEKKNRPSKIKMWLQIQLFKNPYLYTLQKKLAAHKYKRRGTSNSVNESTEIYLGCGSCFILTRSFFDKYPSLNYPIFLYGEELYIAELCLKAHLKVVYIPQLKTTNIGGVSTSLLPTKSFLRYNYEAIKFIYQMFFK